MDAKAKVVAYYSPITNHVVRDQPNSVYIPLIPESSLDELRAEYEQLHRGGVQMVKDYEVMSTRLVSLLTGLEALAGEMRQQMNHVSGGLEGSWSRWQHDTYERIEADIRTLTNSAKE